MKKSIHILIVFTGLLLLLCSGVFAQKDFVPEKTLTTESNTLNYKLAGKQYYNMVVPSGSVFLFDEWKEGYVKLINGDRYDNLSLRYNIFYDELIQVNNRSVSMIMLDKNTISEFGFYNMQNGETMTFTKMYFPKNPDGDYYFNALYTGNLKLVVRHRSLEEETNMYKDAYGMMRNTKFNTYQNYYVILPGDQFERLRLKRRSFVELFSPDREQRKEIKRILRRNRLNFRNDEETIQAVKLVDEAFFPGK